MLTGTGGGGGVGVWGGGVVDEGGGKRWMKCRGNEEIKIGTKKYDGEEDTAIKKTASFEVMCVFYPCEA